MFKNHYPVHFLTHYLNTSVFSFPSQTQFSVPYEESFLRLVATAQSVALFTALANICRPKSAREQIHHYRGGNTISR